MTISETLGQYKAITAVATIQNGNKRGET
jgi:hypothetical protein